MQYIFIKRFLRPASLVAVAVVSLANSAFAQPKKVVADRIIGQVGDKIILHSDIFNSIMDAQRQGMALPPNPECVIVQRALIEKAMVLQAEKDSLPVSDDEVDAAIDNQIRGFVMTYGSKEMVEEVAGKTIYQLKEDYKDVFRDRALADQMRKKIVENVKITPNEVKDFYQKIPKDSLAFYETELELGEIVLHPKANREVESYVTKELNDWKTQVENGAKKFEQLARSYTEDPGSKESGGQYNLNRSDKFWDPAFLSAAFKLKEGQVSPVVKSKFGLHIIQLVSRSGDDAVVRHILRIPPVTQDEIKESSDKLDSIKTKLIAGKISFGEAVAKYSEDEGAKFSGGRKQAREGSSSVTIDQLDKDMVLAIKNLNVGEFSQPIPFADERGKKGVRLVYLQSRTEPHRENLRDDYSKVAQRAMDEKKGAVLEKWFRDHIPNYYIQIDPEFANCESVKDLLGTAKAK